MKEKRGRADHLEYGTVLSVPLFIQEAPRFFCMFFLYFLFLTHSTPLAPARGEGPWGCLRHHDVAYLIYERYHAVVVFQQQQGEREGDKERSARTDLVVFELMLRTAASSARGCSSRALPLGARFLGATCALLGASAIARDDRQAVVHADEGTTPTPGEVCYGVC